MTRKTDKTNMIPYFEWRVIQLGPLTLQVWGLFAAIGVIFGAWFAMNQARKRGLDAAKFERLVFSVIVWAFVGARVFHILFYAPGYYFQNPAEILKVWHGGLSSFGGFIGAALAFFSNFPPLGKRGHPPSLKLRLTSGEFLPLLPTADSLASALPLGLGCGRIGCFLIHDHPGTLAYGAGKWLAVNYPDGPRYDLGLFLGIFDFLLFGAFLWLLRKPRKDGFYFALFMTAYGPVRFLLDFLRATDLPGSDTRYFGLTPAQYGSITLFLLGARMLRSARRSSPSSRSLPSPSS